MSEIVKAKIHISGIVQGVGFRPFIYGLAMRFGLAGWVKNTSAGVDIEVDGRRETLDDFVSAVKEEIPPLARIDSLEVAFGPKGGFDGFEIFPSEAQEGAFQPISPDVSVCPDCLREMSDQSDRRYRYPFINCTNCGPRFTIIRDVPYDRPKTTMGVFPMCSECAGEYANPLDRRFHAQPVACPKCGPRVWLEEPGRRGLRIAEEDEAIRMAIGALAAGKIVAIRGLGGFHLACDATDEDAVSELRRRKLRVDKPFALMMPDLETVEEHCEVCPAERELLESRQRPIVLLARKAQSTTVKEVAPGQTTLGVMLPCTPLHTLLFDENIAGPRVLVMTSGNVSEEPIATGNQEARDRLGDLADVFLMHDREIHVRCDDSVVRVAMELAPLHQNHEEAYFYRRSRGYAPDPVQVPFNLPALLAVGPELKNTFCLTRERYAFISHHIGDMANYETLRSFEDGIVHFENLFRIQPESIVHDLHPDYLSTQYAFKRGKRDALPTLGVQHHHAHIAACMADNGIEQDTSVIGLAFDGTGYGTDRAIWGGEVLLAGYNFFERKFHLDYFPLPGGDAAIKHPARTALALLWSLEMDWEDWLAPLKAFNAEQRQALRTQLDRKINAPKTSSMGRLFDACASLAGIRNEVNFEAQAAIEFEVCCDESETSAYPFALKDGLIDVKAAIDTLIGDVEAQTATGIVSARFHNGLVEVIRTACDQVRTESGIRCVALSGGVWQNMVLLKKTVIKLRADGFVVLTHRLVPTNDGGVSLGQAMVGSAQLKL